MLNKRHNSVITLAILLTLVGVDKPAKAFLLAQSDAAPATFAVPDRLAEDAEVSISASNSTNGITSSLKDSFAAKYPDAEVKIEVQDSDAALQNVIEGKVDLAAIGRSLTAAEKAQGLISVPISREKIAIVVSPNNPYDGNLTIGEFAQIFRGEITDWSAIGGAPGAIKLVDLPDVNDTRTAFPNYPVFQSADFATGATAEQLQQDSTDAMIAELGENGIGYAVANDVINRDDVKIVTMHQTQPDDPRYPFSQPFSLVYQGTPSEAAQAYIGFASGEGGQEIVTSRVGSISTAAVTAIAPVVGAGLAGEDDADVDPEAAIENPDDVVADVDGAELDADVDGVDIDPEAAIENPDDVVADVDGAELDADVESVDIDPEAAIENPDDVVADADVNPDLEDSGTVNSDLEESGTVDPNLNGSGTVNSDLDGSGTVDPDLDGSGAVDPDLEGSGEPLSSEGVDGEAVVPNETVEGAEGTEVAAKKGRWWLWLLPLLAIPLLLGAKALFGGGSKSDQEPALSNVPNVNSPDGGISVPGMSGRGNVALDNNLGSGLGNVAEGAVNTTSRMGAAGLAAGGAALAGGAAAAANLAGRKSRVENRADADLDLDLDLDETPTVEEIPSTPVTEFTGQEVDFDDVDLGTAGAAGLGIGGVAASGLTQNRIDDSETTDLELDTDVEEFTADQTTDLTETNLERTVDTEVGSEVVSAEFRGDYVLPEETVTTPGGSGTVFNAPETDLDPDNISADVSAGNVTTPDVDLPNVDRPNAAGSNTVFDTETNFDTDNAVGNVITPDVDLPDVDSPDVNIPDASDGTGILDGVNRAGGAAIAGGAAALGGAAAAASGMFNRGKDAVEDVADTSVNVDLELDTDVAELTTNQPDVDLNPNLDTNLDTNLDLEGRLGDLPNDISADVTTPNVDLPDVDLPNIATPDVDLPDASGGTGVLDGVNRAGGAAIAGGAAALGGAAAAASGMFNRGKDAVEDATDMELDTEIDLPSSDQDTDLVGGAVEGVSGSVATPDVNLPNVDLPDVATPSADLPDVELSSVDTPSADLPNVELPNVDTPSADLPDVDLPDASGGTGILDGVNRAGGAAIAGGAAALGGAAAAASGMFNRGKDAVEDVADTSVNADLELDTDVAELTTNQPDVDLNPNLDTNLDTNLDLEGRLGDLPNDISADVTTPNVDLPDVDLPNVDTSSANLPDVDLPDASSGTGILDGVNRAGGAAIAGGAAALGGAAAAASGMFNRGKDAVEDATDMELDTEIDLPSSDQDTDLIGGAVEGVSGSVATPDVNLPNVDLPDVDLPDVATPSADLPDVELSNVDTSSADLPDVDLPDARVGTGILDGVNRAGGAAIAGGAAALGGAAAAASGMFKSDEQPSADIQEFETFETSFDLTADTTPTSFADNVVADAETTSIEETNIDDITLDNVADTADLNLEAMTLSDTDSSVDLSLQEITFDDAADEITLDSSDTTDVNLNDISLDSGTANLTLEEISFDDVETNLNSDLDVGQVTNEAEISLDNLGFEESEPTTSFDLLSDNTAEITSLSDDKSNDMNNISEWLDSLETPNKDSDNISNWLDTLDKDSVSSNPNSTQNTAQSNLNQDTNTDLIEEADDISFQFLEDLLDRDSDADRNS